MDSFALRTITCIEDKEHGKRDYILSLLRLTVHIQIK